MMNASHAGRRPVWPDRERREMILRGAEQVFDLRGYGDATMEEVAHVCGMSKKTIYKFFPDKAALFNALVDSHDQPKAPATVVAESGDARGEIKRVLFELASFILSERQINLVRLVIAEARKTPALAERFHGESVDRMLSLFVASLPPDHVMRRIAGGDALLVADMFLGAALGPLQMRALMLKVSREELERELKARIDVAADLLLRTLDGGRYPVELSNASSSPSPNSDREPPKPLS